jgi:acetyl-CoA carboxylase carboxyl transferase subunit alpha
MSLTTTLQNGGNMDAGRSHPAVVAREFLFSMVQTHWADLANGHADGTGNANRNGNRNGYGSGVTMESVNKAQDELERIEQQIGKLEALSGRDAEAGRMMQELHGRVSALRRQIDAQLDAWQRTELARHPQRPYLLDYVERIFTDWSEIHGDRNFADDAAIICGMARFHGEDVLIVGHQKARDTKQKVYRNFGMPNPEGYRKALRAMQFAEKFGRPILTFVDTPGAYPGIGAEERGQGEAIARNLREMAKLRVPIVTTITGEGGSGGALAIAASDRVLMMENSVYSVISPEGCASIMWRDPAKRDVAAQAMRITAKDLQDMKCIDGIIQEPEGGAHRDHEAAAVILDAALQKYLAELKLLAVGDLLQQRYQKFRTMGQFYRVEG